MSPEPRLKLKSARGWAAIPRKLRRAVAGLSARELNWRGGSDARSIREYVHHLVEANLVASTIVVAALGSPGCTFDWSWMMPDEKWMKRLGYDRLPLEPAIELLEALCAHVAGLLSADPESLNRRVRLVGAAGTNGRRRTVEQLLEEECEHARRHLRDVTATIEAHRRTSRPVFGRRAAARRA